MDSPPAPSPIWWVNRVLNTIGLIAGISVLGFAVFLMVGSFTGASFDPHGYGGIFGFIIGVVLLAPLLLLVYAALALWRLQRSGFVLQAIAGLVLGVYGAPISFTAGGWVPVALGAALFAPALAGTLMTRERNRHRHSPAPDDAGPVGS